MFILSFYVPEDALPAVKAALFKAGAGKVGRYDQCCWQVKGRGQFRPLPGSEPAIGTHDQVCTVEEWKVEMVCEETKIGSVVAALKHAHPYEEVAYSVVKLIQPGLAD